MTTEIWRVHILWIFQITKITRAKSPIQNCLSSGFQERVGVAGKYWQFPHEPPCHNCIFQALSPLGLQFGNGIMISKAKS